MRIPIDNNTKGVVLKSKFTDIADIVYFKPSPEGDTTLGEFKDKYFTTKHYAFIPNEEALGKYKNFKFKEPLE